MSLSQQEKKIRAAQKAIEFIKPGMCIGLGSGSTSEIALRFIGEVAGEMQLSGVPTSEKVADLARSYGIPLRTFAEVEKLDLNIDGADEVDTDFSMIKGGGGAMLREKIIIKSADKRVIIVDESKLVDRLGAFPLPIEVNVFGNEQVVRNLKGVFGVECSLRRNDHDLFVTDNGNYIIDAGFQRIEDPLALDTRLKQIPGVLETGLFIGLLDILIVGRDEGTDVKMSKD